MKKVSILGLGYVGFPLACAIAKNKNYDVYGFDVSCEKVDLINKQISPIDDAQAEKDIKEVKITATTDFSLLNNSDIVIITVPTPVDKLKVPDLNAVEKATKSILPYLVKNQMIILESTVNPGVCEEVVLPILESTGMKGGVDFDLIHCPERIDPGNKKYNIYNIPRNVGGTSLEGTKKAGDFYRSFLDAHINEVSSLKAAEATKIIENTFRDINIAYVNELAKSFDVLGLDIMEVINGAANKPFGFMAHYPGCGVGGHCIPVDPYYLIERAKNGGFDHKFLRNARRINESMPLYTIERLIFALNELELPVKGTNIALLGLSYKANVGDLRDSPALVIRNKLEELGANLMVSDPYVEDTTPVEEALKKATVVIIATNHYEFIKIKDWKNVKLIVDGRNCLDMDEIKSKGIVYKGIGRGFYES